MQSYIIWAIISYLVGNFATSYLISRALGKIDIRQHGSGNAGATNVLRVLGLKAAIATLLGDALKGALVVALAKHFGDIRIAMISALAVILGHNFPALLKFKGGKGIATSIGVFFVIDPLAALIPILIGIVIIVWSRYVSLGSISGMASLPIVLLLLGRPLDRMIFGLAVALLAIYQHRSNIKRLLSGTENKIGSKG